MCLFYKFVQGEQRSCSSNTCFSRKAKVSRTKSIISEKNSKRGLGWGSMGLQLLVTILTNYTTNNHHLESGIYSRNQGAKKSKTWQQAGSTTIKNQPEAF